MNQNLYVNKTNDQIKGSVLGLALKQRRNRQPFRYKYAKKVL